MFRAIGLALLGATACLEAPPGGLPDAAVDPGSGDGGDHDGAPNNKGTTCATILAASPDTESGHQLIDPDGTGAAEPIDVYCDMSIDGGGWMLVARSAGGDDGVPFGWLHDTGAVDEGNAPYSLSVNRPGLTFSELLVGNRGVMKQWGDHVYRIRVPEGFVADYETTALGADPETVVGACVPDGGPAMLQFVGHTDAVGHFYLRDNTVDQNFGFYPTGFALSDDASCAVSGGLDGWQGMIFVR